MAEFACLQCTSLTKYHKLDADAAAIAFQLTERDF